ncbi:hypothetical protein ACPXCS_06330 [Streptomyces sp. DT190]|uniref:hypothetical protein n=1 Tax=unclassified Streptomyces TaxID=2593676 RepID=UPI003CFA2806
MASSSRNRIPTQRDIAHDDYVTDTSHGRRYCPQHRSQQMIPIGWANACPLDHGDREHERGTAW